MVCRFFQNTEWKVNVIENKKNGYHARKILIIVDFIQCISYYISKVFRNAIAIPQLTMFLLKSDMIRIIAVWYENYTIRLQVIETFSKDFAYLGLYFDTLHNVVFIATHPKHYHCICWRYVNVSIDETESMFTFALSYMILSHNNLHMSTKLILRPRSQRIVKQFVVSRS